MIVFMILLALGLDAALYLFAVGRGYRWGFVGASLLSYGLMLGVVVFRDFLILEHPLMHWMLWIALYFMLLFLGKLVFSVVYFGGFLVRIFVSGLSRRVLVRAGLIAAAVPVLIMLYGTFVGRSDLVVRGVELQSPKLPEAFDGFKIAVISDLHIGNFGGNLGLLERCIDEINAQRPDIVVQCGDLVNIHSGELTDEIIELLSGIVAPTYGVLGNHDLAYYIFDSTIVDPDASHREVIAKQEAMGWRVLDNQSEWIFRRTTVRNDSTGVDSIVVVDSILLGGVTFPSNHHHNGLKANRGRSDLPHVMKNAGAHNFAVVASHSPALFDSTYTHTQLPDLMLSGHTHSMQTKLKIGGWQWSPAKFLYEKYSGLYQKTTGQWLYINDGLGHVGYPTRIGARPELTIITLKSLWKATTR